MSVQADNGGLSWKASIDTSELEKDAQKMAAIINEAAKKSQLEQENLLKSVSKGSRSQVQDGLEALKSLTPEMQKQIAIIQTFQQELQKVKATQKELDGELARGTISQRQYNQATQGLSVRYSEINENLRKYSDTLRANRAIEEAASGSIDQKRLKLQQMVTAYNALSETQRRNSAVGGKLAQDIKKLDQELSKASSSIKGLADNSAVLNRIFAATAGLFTLTQGKRFAQDIIQVRGEIEQLEVAFATILKSKEKANVLFREIVEIANATPFTVTEVADGAKQLLAYGFAADEVSKQILAIGNVAKGTGSTFQEIAYAYGTLKTQGRAFARDIRQFTGRGVPIVAELAKQFGVSEEKVNDLVSAGKVGFPEIEKAFKSMTSEGGTFFNLMEEQSKTVTGLIAILTGKIQLMLNDIGESNEGFIKQGISGLIGLVENYEKVVEILQAAVVVYGSYRAALILTTAAQKLVVGGTVGMTSVTALNTIATGIATKATALWGAAMSALPLIGLTALIASIVTVIYSWNKAVDSATASAKRLSDIQAEGQASAKKEADRAKDYINIIKSETASISQKEAAMRSLQTQLGDYIEGYSMEEIAAGKAATAIDKYTESLRKSVEVKTAFDEYNKLADQILEIEKKGVDALDSFEQAGQNLKNVFSLNGRSVGQYFKELFFVDDQTLIDRNIQALKDQRDALKEAFDFTDLITGNQDEGPLKSKFEILISDVKGNFDELIKIASNKDDLDKIKKGLTEFLEKLSPSDPQIEGIKKQIQKVNDALKVYSISEENKNLKDLAGERKKILEDLNKMEAETFVKGFDKRQQEIEKVKLQFEELRKAAKEAGLGAGVQDRINRLEERRTGDITYRSDTEDLKNELERRKDLYKDFEVYARDFGIQAAEERYSKELDVAKSYLQLIQDEYDKLIIIQPEERTGVQNERLEYLDKELRDEKRVQEQKYNDFLKSLEDYETKRAQLTEKFLLERQRLIEKGDTQYIDQLNQNYQEDIGNLDDANAKKLGLYQKFFKGLDTLTVASSKKLIAELRNNLEQFKSQNRVTDEFYREMLDRLNQAELQTNMRIPQGLKSIAQEFASIAQQIGGANKGLGQMLGILGDSLNKTADIKANIASFQLAAKANDGKGDFFGMASAGLGVFGAALGIMQSISGAFERSLDRQTEILKKQYEFQKGIFFGEIEISRIMRERDLEKSKANANTIEGLKQQRDILKTNLEQIKAETKAIEDIFSKDIKQTQLDQLSLYDFQSKWNKKEAEKVMQQLADSLYVAGTKTVKGGFLGLGKKEVEVFKSLSGLSFEEIENLSIKGQLTAEAEKLFRELKKLKEEGVNVEKQFKEIEAAYKNILTGGQTSSAIADTIIEGFKAGKRSVEDFGDDVEEILRKAILSGFKYKFLEAPLNALLEQLYQDSLSEDELSKGEIENFQKAFGNIIEEYTKVFDDLEKATGISLSGAASGTQKGLSGAIRREMTEATAGELAGLWRGQFDITKRQLLVATDSLNVQLQIERNTLNTVAELKGIAADIRDIRNSSSSASNGRDLGLDP
jgi:tape measure domain-containing protein